MGCTPRDGYSRRPEHPEGLAESPGNIVGTPFHPFSHHIDMQSYLMSEALKLETLFDQVRLLPVFGGGQHIEGGPTVHLAFDRSALDGQVQAVIDIMTQGHPSAWNRGFI
jgi:hypothetical protein